MYNTHCTVIFCMCFHLFSTTHSAIVRTTRLTTTETDQKANLFEGDILLDVQQKRNLSNDVLHTAAQLDDLRWPNATIPYIIESSLQTHSCAIRVAMMQIMLQSCLLFREKRPTDRHYLTIFRETNDNRCYAAMGISRDGSPTNGERPLHLGPGCTARGIILHELMHSLGFYHEQNRADRDRYVKIHFDRIHPRMRYNYNLNKAHEEQTFSLPFDFDSLMIYGPNDFSLDGKLVTMESKVPGKRIQNPAEKLNLSSLDIAAINELYRCASSPQRVCSKMVAAVALMKSCKTEAKQLPNLKAFAKQMLVRCKQLP